MFKRGDLVKIEKDGILKEMYVLVVCLVPSSMFITLDKRYGVILEDGRYRCMLLSDEHKIIAFRSST
jgi:hypothetical protein